MKIRYILFLLIVLTSCATKPTAKLSKKELFKKLSDGFIIQKLPDWEFHGFHGVLNYTPTELMTIGQEYIYNGIIAYKRELKNEKLGVIDKMVAKNPVRAYIN